MSYDSSLGPRAEAGHGPAAGAGDDVIEVREILAVLGRGWPWILAGVVAGVLAAAAITAALPERYEATATVLLRGKSEMSGLPLDVPGAGGLAGFLGEDSEFETELEILTSRSVLGDVVDEIGLQAQVVEPAGTAPGSIFSIERIAADVAEGEYAFRWTGEAYAVEAPSGEEIVVGRTGSFRVGGAVLALRGDVPLPREFVLLLIDRQDAVAQVERDLDPDRAGGSVAELVYRAGDPITAAAVPNAMVTHYTERRNEVERDVNRRREEFLAARVDSVYGELLESGATLRDFQLSQGTLDPTRRLEGERALALRAELDELQIEARALERLLDGDMAPSVADLAAFPTFLRNAAINDLLSRLLETEAERGELLQRRTMEDPEVVAKTENIEFLREQLAGLARSYLQNIEQRQTRIRNELSGYTSVLARRQEEGFPLQGDYERLTESYVALQNQLLQARLATMSVGTGVRPIDAALPPKRPAFPVPWVNLLIGLGGGLLVGLALALGRGYLGSTIRDPREAELASGIPALAVERGAPFVMNPAPLVSGGRCILIVPVGACVDAGALGRQIAAGAALQGRDVVLVLTAGSNGAGAEPTPLGPGGGAADPETGGSTAVVPTRLPEVRVAGAGFRVLHAGSDGLANGNVSALRASVADLERGGALVVVTLPGLHSAEAAALLSDRRPVFIVGRSRELERGSLLSTVETIQRGGGFVEAIVVQGGDKAFG